MDSVSLVFSNEVNSGVFGGGGDHKFRTLSLFRRGGFGVRGNEGVYVNERFRITSIAVGESLG